MRVITGTARGRRLITPQGSDVRPTTDKVKESMFSILQFELEGRRVLDLFAGSGQLGIEALSRGAAFCTFVDSSRRSLEIVKQNLALTGLADRAQTVCGDALSFLRRSRAVFDIAFLDPPYESGLLQKALPLLSEVLAPGGAILCEAPADRSLPAEAGSFRLFRSYRYGKVTLHVYRLPQEET